MSKQYSTAAQNYEPFIHAIPAINSHHFDAIPAEAVGIVWQDGTTLRLPNSTPSDREFTVTVDDLAEAFATVPATNQIYALYHSHPRDDAYPSVDDRKMMEELAGLSDWQNILHIISGIDAIRVFLWDNGNVVLEYEWQI